MDVQKGSSAKDTSGPLSSVNSPISVAAPKPLSSDMDSSSVFPTKTTSFASSTFYPPIVLNFPAPSGGGIKSKAMTSSLSGNNPPSSFGALNPFSSLDNAWNSEAVFFDIIIRVHLWYGIAPRKVDSSSFLVGSFSFGSPVSASSVSKPIFEIKATEDKNKISTPTFGYGSGKNIISVGSLASINSPKSSGGGFSA